VAIQRFATDTLRRHLLALQGRAVGDSAVLVADNPSGDILAYVGSSAELSSAPHVDGVLAHRQAGSALKPFLYALAFDERLLTPASLIEDTPLEIPLDTGLYRPQNYDEQFHGLVSTRTALASSLNVPAVRVLQLVGGEPFVQQLRRLGFGSVTESGDYYGPALALGAAEVSLWDLVTAYRALANGGVWRPLRLRSEEPAGADGRRVYSEAAAFLVSSILSDRESRSLTFGLENPLITRYWSAVKTGTSKEMRDNWCVGYSRRYTVGVWVGNFSGQPMRDVSGVSGAAPVWLEVMNHLHRDAPSPPPHPPASVVVEPVAFPAQIEAARAEWFHLGTQPATALQLAGTRPHIVAPVPGTIVALDPDIPAAQQALVFEAASGTVAARWRLDGRDLGSAAAPTFWPPRPGRHTLHIVDAGGRVLDTAAFTVRGTGVR
jgi:penicillin-binding protein 1C